MGAGAPEIERFLTDLAVKNKLSPSTQNQALAALLFLYREVLGVTLPWMDDIWRARKPRRLPVVLTRREVQALLAEMAGVHWLMAGLLYGAGLRLMECVRLRVEDVDIERRELLALHGKGGKDRHAMLPSSLVEPLQGQLAEVRRLHQADLRAGFGRVWLPNALARKYPNAPAEWADSMCFPRPGAAATRATVSCAGII